MSAAVWWYLARASGLVAWGLVTATVVWGLAVSGHVLAGRPRPAWVLDLHRHLAALSLAFTGVHLAALVADGYVHFGPAELLVPLASAWHPVAVAWGVLGLYLLVAVQGTSLLQRRLPKRAWRAVHRTAVALYLLVTVHALAAGSDAGSPAARWFALGSLALVAFLLSFRLLGRRRAGPAPSDRTMLGPRSGRPRWAEVRGGPGASRPDEEGQALGVRRDHPGSRAVTGTVVADAAWLRRMRGGDAARSRCRTG